MKPASNMTRGIAGCGGFSLTELMVVMIIIGIISAATVPHLAVFNSNQRVRNSASEIETFLKKARSFAITHNTSSRVAISVETGDYVLQLDEDNDGTFEREVISGRLHDTVTIASMTLGGTSTITFNGRGVPSEDGSIVIQSVKGDHARRLDIAPGSGAVTIKTVDPLEQ